MPPDTALGISDRQNLSLSLPLGPVPSPTRLVPASLTVATPTTPGEAGRDSQTRQRRPYIHNVNKPNHEEADRAYFNGGADSFYEIAVARCRGRAADRRFAGSQEADSTVQLPLNSTERRAVHIGASTFVISDDFFTDTEVVESLAVRPYHASSCSSTISRLSSYE